MFVPARLAYAFRPNAPAPILAAAVALAAMFAATPFLIPEVASRYGVSEGSAGLISVSQVGAFAITSFLLPRFARPSARTFRIAGAIFLIANAASALMTVFGGLLLLRLLAGAAAGTMTWIVWVEAMSDARALVSISAAGPLTAFIASPILAVVAGFGDRQIYLLLALVALPGALPNGLPSQPPGTGGRRKVSKSRSNRLLLAALALVTLSGASLFVFVAVAARDVLGLSATIASLAYSLNAGAGIIGARFSNRHKRPGWWLASCAPAAVLTVAGGSAFWYFVGMTWWGFAFWMGIPGVLQMLSARSLTPAERAGDAQAFMAVGRTLGPVVGGGFADAGAYVSLALTAGMGLAISGATVIAVQEGRERLPGFTQGGSARDSHQPIE
ncbi:MAG: hypothetical protein OEO77_11735 [Acidimicrobiia bacterium]|nr:hypothetical protein [Acidimicrobiia bacterium]